MITSRQRIQAVLLSGLLASATFSASAQTPSTVDATGEPPVSKHRMNKRHDGKSAEHRQERQVEYLADLKAKLQIATSQEAAWTTFAAATQRKGRISAEGGTPEAVHSEFEKLTTLQRLDRVQEYQAKHATAFATRADATRAFYAGLAPAQQKTFDAESLRHGRHSHGEYGSRGPRG